MNTPPDPDRVSDPLPGDMPGALVSGSAGGVAGPVTYRELIDIAAGHLPAAVLALAAHPPLTAAAAEHTVHAYRDLLHAMGSHIHHLLAVHPRTLLVDQTTQATLGQARGLRDRLTQAVPHRPDTRPHHHPETVIGHWTASARAVRAATDLLATHTHPLDVTQARSPDATALRYLSERGPALRRLAGLTAIIAETETPLRQLMAVVQGRNGPVRVDLPALAAVRAAAHATIVTGPAVVPADYPVLAGATLARPGIRTDTALHEISDRVAAIRTHAWDLLHHPEPCLDAIVDIARLATQIEATRFRITSRDIPLTARNAPKAGAWHRLWTELRGLRGLTMPQPDIREHAQAVQHRLREILRPPAPPSHSGAGAVSGTGVRVGRLDPRQRRDLAAVLREAGDQLAETAPWTHTALHRLADTGTLYVAAGPAEIGEGHLTWVGGKAVWRPVTIPQDKIIAVNAAYRGIDTATTACGLHPAHPGVKPAVLSTGPGT